MKGNKDDGSTGWFPSSHVCQLNQDSVRQPSANGSRAQPVSTAMNGETVKSKSSDINTTNTPNNNSSLFSNHIPLPGQVSILSSFFTTYLCIRLVFTSFIEC